MKSSPEGHLKCLRWRVRQATRNAKGDRKLALWKSKRDGREVHESTRKEARMRKRLAELRGECNTAEEENATLGIEGDSRGNAEGLLMLQDAPRAADRREEVAGKAECRKSEVAGKTAEGGPAEVALVLRKRQPRQKHLPQASFMQRSFQLM